MLPLYIFVLFAVVCTGHAFGGKTLSYRLGHMKHKKSSCKKRAKNATRSCLQRWGMSDLYQFLGGGKSAWEVEKANTIAY